MIIAYWLILVFILGASVGSFVNVAASRLPLEKSLLWPGSRCGTCFQRIRWYDNLPLISYLWLRGKCRRCGTRFSIRYFLVELATGLGFAGLFYLEMIENVHHWPDFGLNFAIQAGIYPRQWWIGFACHALLFSFLMVASVCDLEGREIPIQATLTGAVVGLMFAVCCPWPWPWDPPGIVLPRANLLVDWRDPRIEIKSGLYLWPVWGPLPGWLAPGGNWQTGLATGLAGALVGSFLLRTVAFLATAGLKREALGLGDADLMMMAGCFLGWQPVVVAFFISPLPALVVGMFQLIFRRDDSLPYGPSLAIGILVTMLCWHSIGPFVQPLFFWNLLLVLLAATGAVLMFGLTYLMGLLRRSAQTPQA
jgi:leader peptidase (prepilin peptidase) / N-methyltransferase